MRYDQLRTVCCIGCGATHEPLRTLESMSPNLRACPACLARWGPATLARMADETLANATHGGATAGTCRHCGGPVIANGAGRLPLMCSGCEAEWRALR